MPKRSSKDCPCDNKSSAAKGNGKNYGADCLNKHKQVKCAEKMQTHMAQHKAVHHPATRRYDIAYEVLVAYIAILAYYNVEKKHRSPINPLVQLDVCMLAAYMFVVEDEEGGDAKWEEICIVVEACLVIYVVQAFMEKHGYSIRGFSTESKMHGDAHRQISEALQKCCKIQGHYGKSVDPTTVARASGHSNSQTPARAPAHATPSKRNPPATKPKLAKDKKVVHTNQAKQAKKEKVIAKKVRNYDTLRKISGVNK